MNQKTISIVLAVAALACNPARAHGELSVASALSALPLASVVVGASAAAGAVLAVPVALSATGAVLMVRAVEVTAHSTVYVLERASDGAHASVEMLHRAGHTASLTVGTAVTVSVIGAGVVLSAAGEVIAFIPNALGRALLHNERLTP